MATISGVPAYYGTVLKNGSSGPDVAMIQTWNNGLRTRCSNLPLLTVDGKFGSGTAKAVELFQRLTGLTADGKVGKATWDRYYTEYAAAHGEGEIYAGIAAREGNRGAVVKSMQAKLKELRRTYTAIQDLSVDGVFGSGSKAALRQFQAQMGLSADGIMGKQTFDRLQLAIQAQARSSPLHVAPRYPGSPLKVGSRGDSVRFVQSYLVAAGGRIPRIAIDGNFGGGTRSAVMIYQAEKGFKVDGIVGNVTWQSLVITFNGTL